MGAGSKEMGLLVRTSWLGPCCLDGAAGIETAALLGSSCTLATVAVPAPFEVAAGLLACMLSGNDTSGATNNQARLLLGILHAKS